MCFLECVVFSSAYAFLLFRIIFTNIKLQYNFVVYDTPISTSIHDYVFPNVKLQKLYVTEPNYKTYLLV